MRIAIVIVMLALSVSSLPTTAQGLVYTVHGMVMAPPHLSAAEMVRVRLERFGGIPIQEVLLRENRFDIRDVERGHYTLVVSAPDYENAQQEIDVPGDAPVISLRPKRSRVRTTADTVSVWDLKVPKSARREFDAATKQRGQDNCADALEHLKKAIRMYADYGDAHHAMGNCYARLNQMDAAKQELKRALELPHSPDLHLSLGLLHSREGNPALFRRQMELYGEEVGKAR